jgi:hypothetical protein
MSNDDLVPVFIPALAPTLLNAEHEKGAPLTQEEVIRIRDDASSIMVPSTNAIDLAERRGYRDIDPQNCRKDWQNLRKDLM